MRKSSETPVGPGEVWVEASAMGTFVLLLVVLAIVAADEKIYKDISTAKASRVFTLMISR